MPKHGRTAVKRSTAESSTSGDPYTDTDQEHGDPPHKKQAREKSPCRDVTEAVNAQDELLALGSAWRVWGPYLSERQWGTVREDHSADGNCWDYFSHDEAPNRAYQWGEDGLLGICDNQSELCISLALTNGKDPFLKERLFGLTGPQGNHGEDVKELYYYLDNTPTHSYMKALYRYPQQLFPYKELIEGNAKRSGSDPEYEILDTGCFDDHQYWDVTVEYAKSSPTGLVCRYTIHNRHKMAAQLQVLPQLLFRNTWYNNRNGKEHPLPEIKQGGPGQIHISHPRLGPYRMYFLPVTEAGIENVGPLVLITNNETNMKRKPPDGYTCMEDCILPTKDLFSQYITAGVLDSQFECPNITGTKAAGYYRVKVPPGGSVKIRCHMTEASTSVQSTALSAVEVDSLIRLRKREADKFYEKILPSHLSEEARNVARQAYAGLLWNKQFYCYDVKQWLQQRELPKESTKEVSVQEPVVSLATEVKGHDRRCDDEQADLVTMETRGRNEDWSHLSNHDIISMPDKWEFPWYAAWDVAFHVIPFSRIDPVFAKQQLQLLLSDRYLHPSGKIPAYEFNFSDMNPPVHGWACLKVYQMTGENDRGFLKSCFHKLLLNYTWWMNQRRSETSYLFSGGFLGLDNISVVDRSAKLPNGWTLDQADGTGWMAFYSLTMLKISVTLAGTDSVYADLIPKFLKDFINITRDLNKTVENGGLWDEQDGFYYDVLRKKLECRPIRARSLVGIVPIFAVTVIPLEAVTDFVTTDGSNVMDLLLCTCATSKYIERIGGQLVLCAVPKDRLSRLLKYICDPSEFLSPFGVRSLSKYHETHPVSMVISKELFSMEYCPGESMSRLFGGNSNWRGPVWLCMNYMILESLKIIHLVGLNYWSAEKVSSDPSLREIIHDLKNRLVSIFMPDPTGRRPCHGKEHQYQTETDWRDLVLFYEYFHSETGRGCGASHQTGWTAVIIELLQEFHS